MQALETRRNGVITTVGTFISNRNTYFKFFALDGLYNKIKLQLRVENVHTTCLFWSYNYVLNS